MQKISFPFGEFQNILVEQLYMCVEFLWKSERYELIADVNKPIIAVFEKQRDFKVCVLNPEVSDNSLHDIGELLIVSKIRNSLFFFLVSIVFMNPFLSGFRNYQISTMTFIGRI